MRKLRKWQNWPNLGFRENMTNHKSRSNSFLEDLQTRRLWWPFRPSYPGVYWRYMALGPIPPGHLGWPSPIGLAASQPNWLWPPKMGRRFSSHGPKGACSFCKILRHEGSEEATSDLIHSGSRIGGTKRGRLGLSWFRSLQRSRYLDTRSEGDPQISWASVSETFLDSDTRS